MKYSKRIISIILSILMIMALLPTSALSAIAEELKDYTAIKAGTWDNGDWSITNDSLTINGSGTLTNTFVDEAGNSINIKYLASANHLSNMTVKNGITGIDEGVFYGTCFNLVVLEQSVASIGKKAFGDCKKLQTIKIENDSINIYSDNQSKENNAFGYDSNGVAITNKVQYGFSTYLKVEQRILVDTSVNSNAFKYAEDNGFVVLGEDKSANRVGYIQKDVPAIWSYHNDTKTLYVEGVYNLAEYPFKMSENSSMLFGGDGIFRNNDGTPLERIEVERLYFCSGVQIANADFSSINPKYIHFSSTVTEIGSEAFKNCDKLKVLNVPDSVSKIDYRAFEGCRSLESVSLSNNMKVIDYATFKNCTSLKEINYGSVMGIDDEAFYNCTGLEEIDIPSQIVYLGSKAFYNCLSVKKITINGGSEYIGSEVFYNMPFCDSLTLNYDYIDSASTIRWNDAFYHLGFSTTGIDLIIGDDVTVADFTGLENSFNDSKTKIRSIHFGKNVTDYANLPDMKYIEKLTVSKENKTLYEYEGNIYKGTWLIMVNPNLSRVIIKDTTTSIMSWAFYESKALQVSLPDRVTEIDDYAFYNAKLRRINFNDKLLKVGAHAFEQCTNLLSAQFPSITNTIGDHCFDGCTSLQSVVLPKYITSIEPYTFRKCSSLKSIVVPKLVNSIGEYAFSSCKSLEDIFLYRTVSKISATWIGAIYTNPPTIHTPAGSYAYQYTSQRGMNTKTYSSTMAFDEICEAQIENDGKFIDICQNGHGATEYLTVYEPSCEYDGYIIGVCEFCSEIVDEIHKEATGHNYVVTAEIEATDVTRGVKQYTCKSCSKTLCEYTNPLSNEKINEIHKITAQIVLDGNKYNQNIAPVRNADIIINNEVVAKTNKDGWFTLQLETGAYTAEIKYDYGYTRTIGIVVQDEDIVFDEPIEIIGVDYNKDGKVDEDDLEMFYMIISSTKNDVKYLDYADLNNDGYINIKDYAIMRSFIGTSADTYEYPIVTIKK